MQVVGFISIYPIKIRHRSKELLKYLRKPEGPVQKIENLFFSSLDTQGSFTKKHATQEMEVTCIASCGESLTAYVLHEYVLVLSK